ncbi:hypothetical protein ABCV09_002760 [Escherichia coli]|uniref:hypothetical protein n=1 Tax=Escherichia coli TaxID=562 RepID=UPI0017545FAF|nr:hypothetical protein [Escherichia coli]ELC8307029.1 hypothetical protein [Escherichia coli]HAI8192854.1 hypothetical protein [Escherichia coli]HAN5145008.1 hypothetical protein [Escherichia coli]HCT7418312.1 hypothetical protein [Escherichia coli]HDQ3025086.1 hypothetical protein [Escherichia coli]
MEQKTDYRIPDNLKLVGIGFGCRFVSDTNGAIYLVRIIDGVQHIRRLGLYIKAFRRGYLKIHEI